MTPDKNKEVAEALDDRYSGHHTPSGEFVHTSYRDYSSDAGAVQLLRLMEERPDWYMFRWKIGGRSTKGCTSQSYSEFDYIDASYITTKGKLLEAVWTWLKEKGVIK
jgi:hypothetical protein